ncbi:MAG: type I restriction enzyme S subunit [Candidatus Accumulibacter regalis]|jgi:type I restriction enzyme S subunit
MNAAPPVETLVTNHLDLWTAALKRKSTAGRGSSSKIELYGIRKLRELILELAVRGLLVPQDPNDEPASELLKKIAAEKARLVKAGKIKKEKPLGTIGEAERPYKIPAGWSWVRLGEAGNTQTGGTPKKADSHHYGSAIPFIKPGEIVDGEIISHENDGLSFEGAESLGRVVQADSVLMVCIGTIGKCARVDRPVAFNQQINSVSPYLPIGHYTKIALRSNYFQRLAWALSSSTTIPILNKGKWETIPIPLAPLAEQHRIVAKVDELMVLCDQLEQQADASLGAHQTLVETLLSALTSAADHTQFASAWQRIAGHFDTLFTTEESIDQLKQTILQLAVMGKLVPQDPNDEPARELLKKIAAEKAKLVKEGKIKKEKPLQPICEKEKPFALPTGWGWARFQSITSKITDGDHNTPPRTVSGMRMLSAKNVRDGFLDFDNCDCISEDDYVKSRERCLPEEGDLLIVSVGGTIGRSSLVPQDSDFSLVRSVALIKPIVFVSKFLKFLADSPLLQSFIHSHKRGGAQPCLYLSEIAKFPIPVAPLAEQHRIVAKVDELLALCEQLKSRINDAQTTQLHLADALVERAIC